jgi:hypothetical protein
MNEQLKYLVSVPPGTIGGQMNNKAVFVPLGTIGSGFGIITG